MSVKKGIIVSGMRPTGPLHLGHFFGVLENWSVLQKEQECYFFVADLHSLTTEYADTESIAEFTKQMVLNWLASGVDPEKVCLFVQSQVPEHAELHLILSMITPLSWLERVPSYKELRQSLTHKDLSTYGFLGYPLLQTADVILYKATGVPVGQDQAPHLELSREIVRRFNFFYKKEIFPEPQTLLTSVPKLLGLDGRKMSKSYDNCLYLSDTNEVLLQKILKCVTDPARKRRTDPGNPDVCPVYDYHKVVSSPAEQAEIAVECRRAGIGCVDCKKKLFGNLQTRLQPFQEKQKTVSEKLVNDVLHAGVTQARQKASQTLTEVKEVIGLYK